MAVNDRVARATAQDYLESVTSGGATPDELTPAAVGHLLEHATVVKLLGPRNNRLVVEFDMDAEISLAPKPLWAPVPPGGGPVANPSKPVVDQGTQAK